MPNNYVMFHASSRVIQVVYAFVGSKDNFGEWEVAITTTSHPPKVQT